MCRAAAVYSLFRAGANGSTVLAVAPLMCAEAVVYNQAPW
jgi:hypothetical protein